MAYMRNNLIARSGYAGLPGMGDWWDTISSAAGSALKFYQAEEQAKGAANAQAQANRDLQAALLGQQGPGLGTFLVIGGAGLAAFLLLRKRG